MPALTISTDASASQTQQQPANSSSSHPNSPTRPPMSPITPPLPPARFPGDDGKPRQTFSHSSQNDQTPAAIAPPMPDPIDFDSNPDAIALKSAISVLQLQRQRAAADIQALSRVKDQAVQDPEAFVKDLVAGKVNSSQTGTQGNKDDDDDDDDDDQGDNSGAGKAQKPREWASLPKPQDVVRCPPINWSQYAVVGESLDKLHNEQVTHPTQGAPFVVGAGGTYEFKGDGKQERRDGIAAPYAPGKDKIDRKPKSKK